MSRKPGYRPKTRNSSEYRKEMPGIWEIIGNQTETAVRNAKLLERQCLDKGMERHTVAFAPSTEVYKIIEILIS